MTQHWDEVEAGRWRLGLAVANPNAAAQQLGELGVIARSTPDNASFRAEVAQPGRTTQAVRDRLGHLDTLVQAAAREAGLDGDFDTGVLAWRLLFALRMSELRLEGPDETDRTTTVSRLRTVARDGTQAAADKLFSKLVELAGRYAPTAGRIDRTLLSRDLSGTPLGRAPSMGQAWQLLDRLAARLRDRTGFDLTDPTSQLELGRAAARQALATEMTAVGTGGTLLVHGDPDVGKSALTLRAAEEIEADGAVVTILSMRDLPATTGELETLLGGGVDEILSGTAAAPARLLVLDGAESVLEGRGTILLDLATAALRAGLGVVAVSRRDGATAVAEVLRQASASAGVRTPARRHEVTGLTIEEAREVVATFRSLTRISEEPSATWLLARPGLLDLLLGGGGAGDLPAGPLSEAEVFDVAWRQRVRRGESHEPGFPSPDARDRAMVALARQLLVPDAHGVRPDADALPSLRSDGLLLPLGPTSAWAAGDQFASDLIRDLAVARLLITDGWGVLDAADAPRWALRAVRLACQAKLAAATDTEAVRVVMQATFDDLARRHGARWAEVPLEAILTLGSARDALTNAQPQVVADDGALLRILLRLALQRYTEYGFGDPIVLSPLVELAFCADNGPGPGERHGRGGTGEQIRELLLAWLRGLVKAEAGPLPLRQQVRDRILAGEPRPYDKFAVEALGMLGPDLDERAENFLRGLGGGRRPPLAGGRVRRSDHCDGHASARAPHRSRRGVLHRASRP